MADRKLELNISADSKSLQADLANLLNQLNQLNKTAATFNTALVSGFSKIAIEQEKLNQAAGQTLIIEERLSQAAIKSSADRVRADQQAIAGREKLNQTAAQTLIAEEKASQAAQRSAQLAVKSAADQQKASDQQAIAQQRILQASANRELAEKRLADISRQSAQQQQANSQQVSNGLQGVIFGFNNIFFGLQNVAAIGQSAFSTILGGAQQVQNQILGLTGTFASLNQVFVGSKALTDPLAKIEALQPAIEQSIAKVREISLTISGVTSSQLVDVFQTIATNSSAANLSLQDSVELVKSFSAGLVSANIPLAQQRQEITSILTGQISQDSTLAKQLGITNEIVNREKSRGTLVQFLNERLKTSVAIQEKFADTLEGVSSNIQEIGEITLAKFGGELLTPITNAVRGVYKFLDENKDAIFGFVTTVASAIASIGSSIGQVLGAAAPLVTEFTKSFDSSGSSFVLVANAVQLLANILTPLVSLISTVLTPVLQVLNTDLGKVVTTVSLLVFGLGAATVELAVNIGLATIATIKSIAASTAKIAATTAEAFANGVLTASLGRVAAAQTAAAAASQVATTAAAAGNVALANSAAGLAATASSFAIVAAGLIAAAAAIAATGVALVYLTEQSKNADLAQQESTRSTEANFQASKKVVEGLQALQRQRDINGKLTEEEARKERALIDLGQQRVKSNEIEIKQKRDLANQYPERRAALESEIKNLEAINGQLTKLKTEGLPVQELGGSYKFLADQVANAQKVIGKGTNEAEFKTQVKVLADVTKQQVESGEITRQQAIAQLDTIANNLKIEVATRQAAQKEILKLTAEQNSEELGLLKSKEASIQAIVADGQITDVEGIKQATELKKQQLDIQTANAKEAYDKQLQFLEANQKASVDKIKENLAAAQTNLAGASSPESSAIAKREVEKLQAELLQAENNFGNQRNQIRQKFEADNLKLIDERKKAERDAIQQQVAALRGSLDRELSANADLRKKAELATQADIQALKLGGFENDRQLEEQTLLIKKQTIESELFDKRRVLEFDKTNLANFVGSQKEKEELILKIGSQEADIAKLNLDATDNLIARNKLLYDQKIGALEIEKTSTDRVSKLLESQNSLLSAQVKLWGAIADAQLKGAENQLSALKDADTILKGNREKAIADEQKQREAQRKTILDGLDEEGKKKQEAAFAEEDAIAEQIKAAKQGAINKEKERLTRQRLAELGVSAGQSELSIARQIFDQEQKVLELKARKFEQEQANAKRELEVQIQQSQIRDKQLQVEAQIALIKAKASGSNEAIASALELVALTGEQVKNNEAIAGLQRQTLDVTQQSERETFNKEQESAAFKTKITGAESGLVGLQSSGNIKAGIVQTPETPKEAEARKKLAEAKTPEKVKAIQDERKQDLADVADGAVAFEGTSQQVKDNFASLPDSLKATKAGLQEVIAQAKELSENPIFKSREEQAAKQKQAEAIAQAQPKTQTTPQPNDPAIAKGFNAAATAKNAQITKQNEVFGVVDRAIANNSDSSRLGQIQNLKSNDPIAQADDVYAKILDNPNGEESKAYYARLDKKLRTNNLNLSANKLNKLQRFTGGLTPANVDTTVNERGQEAVTNLQTLETSLLPNGERTVQFDAPTWVHNASETKQLGSLGVFDSNQLPNINFGAIASALRINNADVVRELKLQNSLLSQLGDRLAKPNVINNFTNDPRPDLTSYRVASQLLRV
jgi:hypothetical protein